jgi:dolichyl-phosphate beta-glucosyltransferase
MSRRPAEETNPGPVEQSDKQTTTSQPATGQPARQSAAVLSIAIPAYNEAENLTARLSALDDYLARAVPQTQVIIVDDGSEDATPELVLEFSQNHPRFSLIQSPHRGKAGAVATGVRAAEGEYVLFMDMDMATSIEHIGEFVAALEKGDADIIAASREAHGAVRMDAPLMRRFLGKGFNLLVQALLLPGITDTQCGFKALTRDAARDLFGSLIVFDDAEEVVGPRVTAFDVELLVAARRRGYRIEQRGVRWRHTRSRRVDLMKEPVRMLRQLLMVWLNDRRGRYGRRKATGSPPSAR